MNVVRDWVVHAQGQTSRPLIVSTDIGIWSQQLAPAVSALTGEETFMDTLKNNKDGHNTWLTQKELAKRWHVSPSSIINWRNNGKLPFFRVPGSTRVLYPLYEIIALEQQHTTKTKEGPKTRKQPAELQLKKPVVSTKSQKIWRI